MRNGMMHRRDFLKLSGMGALALLFSGCSDFGASSSMGVEANVESAVASGTRMLIIYFSVPETDNPNGMTKEEDNSVVVIDGKVYGNTEYFAQIIAEETQGDLVRLLPKEPYTRDHKPLVELAKREKEQEARPALGMTLPDLSAYDTVFIGYPIWWADLPMPLYTMFDAYDFTGKIIVPFSTHGGSGWASTPRYIAELEPQAKIAEGLSISRDDIETAAPEIRAWLARIGYAG